MQPCWVLRTQARRFQPTFRVIQPPAALLTLRWAVLPHVGLFDLLLRCSTLRWAFRPHAACFDLVLGALALRWLILFMLVIVCQQAAQRREVEAMTWPALTQPCWSVRTWRLWEEEDSLLTLYLNILAHLP